MVLAKIRGILSIDEANLVAKPRQFDDIVQSSNVNQYCFVDITFSQCCGRLYLGQRVPLSIGNMLKCK